MQIITLFVLFCVVIVGANESENDHDLGLSFVEKMLIQKMDERIKIAITDSQPKINEMLQNEAKYIIDEWKLKFFYLTQTMNEKFDYLKDLINKSNNQTNCQQNETIIDECLISLEKCKQEVTVLKSNLTEAIDGCKPNQSDPDKEELFLSKVIIAIYNKDLLLAGKVLEILNVNPNVEYQILGYRILYDEMKKNGHEYSTVATTITFQVKTFFKKLYPNNKNLIDLENSLPASLKQIPWNDFTNITNQNLKLGFHTQNFLSSFSNYVTPNCTRDSTLNWNITSTTSGGAFILYHNLWKSYLYAARLDQMESIPNRRHVYTWKTDKVIDEEQWQFEPIKGSQYFRIKNLKYNEYLYMNYTEEYIRRYEDHHVSFTSPEICRFNDNCNWKITHA